MNNAADHTKTKENPLISQKTKKKRFKGERKR
jgi:hypothetical protein